MDKGMLVEDGSQFELINNNESHFYKMAAESKDLDMLKQLTCK